MIQTGRLPALVAVLGITGFAALRAQAVEVLVNGNLEASVSPASWNLTTSVTGMPGTSIPSAIEHNDGANEPTVSPGQLGLLIKPQAGNQGAFEGQNKQINMILEQAVNAIVGRAYTFTGKVYWGGDNDAGTNDGYSGGVTTLDAMSPSGAAPSPTQTKFEVAFLDASNAVMGTPTVLDLRTVQLNDAMWHEQSVVSPAAPTGAARVRVRVLAENMVDNFGFQNVQLDNFTLRDSAAPGVERLTNANLNTPGDPLGFVQSEGPVTPQGTPDSMAFINFANHTPGGQQGVWIRPFVNTTQFEPDLPTVEAKLAQTVAGVAGAQYTFSAWTAWETGYSGGIPNGGSQTLLKMEFLNGSGNLIGSPQILDLFAAGMTNDQDGGNLEPDDWRQFSLNATAPAGTANVRVSMEALGLFNSFVNPQSAFFDDFSLTQVVAGVAGDYNGNGVVDAGDYVLWRNGGPLQNEVATIGSVTPEDYNEWRSRFGNGSAGAGSNLLAAVPEPACCSLLLMALAGSAAARRRWM